MTTIILQDTVKLSKTKFINMADLYNFIIDNQIFTEVWYLDKNDLSTESKRLFEKSKKTPLINI